jgi:hypothetical protein
MCNQAQAGGAVKIFALDRSPYLVLNTMLGCGIQRARMATFATSDMRSHPVSAHGIERTASLRLLASLKRWIAIRITRNASAAKSSIAMPTSLAV